jgi:hypothetical protein
MRLFHISEESDIDVFVPRIPKRKDINNSKGLVWALNERCLPNFLTPRDCPRVTYHANEKTTQDDIKKFFSSSFNHCVAIEHDWHYKMLTTSLYIYEFDIKNFYLQDEVAGYYVSENNEIPISLKKYVNLYEELFKKNIEVRIIDNLWNLGETVQKSSLNWSLCRMINAKPKI